jgi:transcriptional regulator with XRE-family HTH domain
MRSIDAGTPAARLKAARRNAGLSQMALAARTGISQPAISEAENAHPPTLLATTLDALCGALGLSLDFVMHGTSAAKTEQEAELLSLLRSASPDMRDAALRSMRALLAPPGGDGKRHAA